MCEQTLDVLGSQHGYGIARRIEEIGGDLLAVKQGTARFRQMWDTATPWGIQVATSWAKLLV